MQNKCRIGIAWVESQEEGAGDGYGAENMAGKAIPLANETMP
jgi:hypothetical protein